MTSPGAVRNECAPVVMPAGLIGTRRLHVDLQRVTSASCRP